MKRRQFVSWVGVGGVMPLAIATCTSQKQETSTLSSPSSDGFQVVGTVPDLKTKGQLLLESTAVGKVLVIVNPANPQQVLAVNPTCTHEGCVVAWQKDRSAFVCPCHRSEFAPDGKVLQGPATKPLPTYVVKLEGDSVLVKAS